MIPLEYYIFLSGALFAIGLVIVLTKKNFIAALMGVELILNAANINLIGFGKHDPTFLQAHVFAIFVIVLAAAEAAIALALVIKIFQVQGNVDLTKSTQLKENTHL